MDEVEIQARVPRVLLPDVPKGAVAYFREDHCANCGDALTHHLPKLFCDTWCQETAEIVRYARATTRDGRYDSDPLIGQTITMRFAFLLIGGYKSFKRHVTPDVREEVIQRDGRCVRCGKPANQLDHIAGNDNTVDNLQLLCDECHREKTAESLVPADEESSMLLAIFNAVRILGEEPILLCDDNRQWSTSWRRLQTERSARLDAQLEAAGIRRTTHMTSAQRARHLTELERQRASGAR